MNQQERIEYLIKNNCSIDGFDLDKDFGYDVDDWARFCFEKPEDARFIQTYLINEAYDKHRAGRNKILLMPNGVEIIAQVYGIKNSSLIKSLKKDAKRLQKEV
ncbi:MAG: hypothetical protein COT14_02015 [Candidatus Diapherotrites archaeon CG08_land_8_20_14_0_20_30_16]|nr:MAG: hypothetical protein COT14_02015 [Candidatus Diapherotrites archaeon CG08_land_8_20_14_0_20_30_16]